MKAIVLAAGYGTRMQSIIGDMPKALIQIGEQTIIDYLYDNLSDLGVEIVIVTNNRYYDQFGEWRNSRSARCELIADGSTTEDNRLGAIGDLALAMKQLSLSEDLLVTAADNLYPFSLGPFVAAFRQHPELHIATWKNNDLTDQARRGVVTIRNGVIEKFEEKPANPSSLDAAAPLYVIPTGLLAEVFTYLEEGGNPDAPGHLMAYLVDRHPARAWMMPEPIIDVGNPASYKRALEENR